MYFFVSTLLEAIELCDCLGSSAIIVVLGGLAHGLSDDWQRYQLLPVLFDEAHVDAWMAYCRRHQQKLPCVLKIDTGMHRLGLMPNTYLQLLIHLSFALRISQFFPRFFISF